MQNKVYDLVVTSLLIALVYLCTRFINIQLPISLNGGGLVHMGNVMMVIASIVYGKKKGAFAGAFGMALFDLTSGYAVWTPFTFIIRGAMGYIMGAIAYKKQNGTNFSINAVAVVVSGIVMVVGYYLAQVILYRNIFTPLLSVPGDLIQVFIGLFAGLPVAMILKRHPAIQKMV